MSRNYCFSNLWNRIFSLEISIIRKGTNTMKTWHEELHSDFSDPTTDRIFTENAIFFDIETTGFSPARTSLYLIGCATRKGPLLCLDQFFAESGQEEAAVISAFFSLLAQYETILTFNGLGFDIPYLKAKCSTYHLPDPFSSHSYVDIYKEVSRMKHLLNLPNLKQKSIEIFLGIQREDAYSGGELIQVYKEYVKAPSQDALHLLRQHNYEDVLYMPKLLPILSYRELSDGGFSVVSLEASEYTAMDGSTGNKELFFTLSTDDPVPMPISLGYGDCYLSAKGDTVRLCIRLFEGELRFFFENPRDYYYLPEEDRAVHKSIASYVDKEYRRQANRENCYTRKHAIFLPQYDEIITPAFREQPKDRKSYFELTEDFIASPAMQKRYVQHILNVMTSRRSPV